MRPIWKGHITFGLVNVPVTLYPAEQRSDLQLHLIDSRDHARVRYERVNAATGEEVPWGQIAHGYEYEDGNFVLLGEQDLKRAAPEATRAVEIQKFVEAESIDPAYFDKPYFLEPAKAGRKGYALLREVLEQTGKVGIAKVVIRTRQYIAAMTPRGKVLALDLLRYRSELRSPDALDLPESAKKERVSTEELKMARMLVESMAGEWNPDEYRDEYREALMDWIREKAKSGHIEPAPEAAESEAPAPINLMDALKRSVGQKAPAQPRVRRTGTRKPARRKAG